ncbi:MAG: hypothetical protein R3A48_23320 [Polyangiales bacterium]
MRSPHELAPLSLAALLSACGAGPSPSGDAGASDVPDARLSDVAVPDAASDAPALRVQPAYDGPERAPDFSCLGARSAPTPSDDGPGFLVEVRDFQLESRLAGARLNVFLGDAALGACSAPRCFTATTDAMGVATLRGQPGATLRVEVLAERRGDNDALNLARSVHLGVRVPAAGAPLALASISEATRRYLPLNAGLTVAPGDGQLMGVARDCAGAALKHARVRVFDAQGVEVALGATGPGAAYTNVLHRPDRAQLATSFNGQFVVVNLPPGPSYRVEAWGRVEGESAARRVACEVLPTWPEAVTVGDLAPLRTPSPGDPCGEAARGP